jgi:hypothetical protein
MRNAFVSLIVLGAAALTLLPNLAAQIETQVQRLQKSGPGGPAPRRDLNGAWAGNIGANTIARPNRVPFAGKVRVEEPSFTPLGLARFKLNKPGTFSTTSNDPYLKCDPWGFPRNLLQESKGLIFAQAPDRIIILSQYDRIGRIVWMDGRELPKNVGAKGGPKNRWYGYSVGHWDGDYTLVVNTNGLLDNTWLDQEGHPHSTDMRVEERYTRVSYNILETTVTVDDPKYYTKPFVLLTNTYTWIPSGFPEFGTTGEFDEQFCVPSDMEEYNKIMLGSADEDQAGTQKQVGRKK